MSNGDKKLYKLNGSKDPSAGKDAMLVVEGTFNNPVEGRHAAVGGTLYLTDDEASALRENWKLTVTDQSDADSGTESAEGQASTSGLSEGVVGKDSENVGQVGVGKANVTPPEPA